MVYKKDLESLTFNLVPLSLSFLSQWICGTIKGFFRWRSFPLFSRPSCLIQGWYCQEKYNASYFYRWKDGKATITAKAYSVSKFASLKRTSILFSAFFPFLSKNLVQSRTAQPHFYFLCCPISLNVENTDKGTNNNKTHRRRIEGFSYVTNLKMDNSLKWVLFNKESGQITSDAL